MLQDLTPICRIAVEAARAIMEIYERPESWAVQTKTDASPVTKADLLANEIIVTALATLTPEIPVLSEESPWVGGDAATYWAVDPLDGTKEFLKRNGEFTVNIALVVEGVAQIGVICAPALKTLWAGVCGGTTSGSALPWVARAKLSALDPQTIATSAWQKISVTNNPAHQSIISHSVAPLARSSLPAFPTPPLRIVGSRSHGGFDYPQWLVPLVSGATMITRGSSLKFCLIAQGEADLYVRTGPTCTWDTAAGHAILAAAGGQVVHAQTRAVLTYPDPRQVRNPDFVAYAPRKIAL